MMQAVQVVVRDSTSHLLTPNEFFNICWSLNFQARFHYGYSPWVERAYAPPAEVSMLPRGASPPPGAWIIDLLDKSDMPGALGYHGDAGFVSKVGASGVHSSRHVQAGIPFAKVFVQTSTSDGVPASEVASHELLEMLVDPQVEDESLLRKVLNHTKREWYIVEVGDPVQGNGYDIGAPSGHHCGVTVADFALPKWWGLAQERPQFSFRESVQAAFGVAPEGYMSVAPENDPTNWSQVYGSDQAPHAPNPQ